MFERLIAFLTGRIYVIAQGRNLAHFINESLRDGIVFFRTQRSAKGMRAQIKLKDFRRLRRAARVTETRIHIGAKYGLPFITARWERRKGLITGTLIIGISLFILSQMVISIEVQGNKQISTPEILDFAAKQGLKTMTASRSHDFDKIAKIIQEEYSNIAWVGIQKRGTLVKIEVVEKVPPKVPGEKGNLVASKNGLVQDVIVIQGTAQIQEGELVRTGQVLIKAPSSDMVFEVNPKPPAEPVESKKGESPVSTQAIPTKTLVAKGFVRGRVWYSSEAVIPLNETPIEETGRIAKGWGIKFGSRVIMVTTPNSPYAETDKQVNNRPLISWRNWRFPVEVITVEYKELEAVRIERTVTEARKLGEQKAREDIKSKVPPGVQILQERVRILSGDSGVQRVRVEVETFEDLAVYPNP